MAAAFRDSLSATATAVGDQPDRLASGLLATARTAFATGFQLAAAASAVLMAATAVMVMVLFGRDR